LKRYFAYARVSTTRQGEQGVSLQQQCDSIRQLSTRAELPIFEWLEEQETAAKQGRPIFTQMLKRLRAGEATGVIMHKIDRSARNLKDWAELGQLIDQGIEVHFSNESVDLTSRGGRLSADIQAVVAADFIRNLREEVKKGFYGRLKQGLTPLPAPLGYLNNGPGKAKTIDPVAGPIIREAFDLYSTGRFGQHALTDEVNRLGLRTRKGKPVSVNVVAGILSNPFYIGVIRLRRSGETYKGVHESLVSPSTFQLVQDVVAGKRVRGPSVHAFTFSRFITCEKCGRSLIAERQKGHVYYRCHKRHCPGASLSEPAIEKAIWEKLQGLHLRPEEIDCIDDILAKRREQDSAVAATEVKTTSLALAALIDRQNRLTDAYLDGVLERADFEQRKTALLMERCDLEQKLARADAGLSESLFAFERKVELIKHASLLYEHGLSTESRDLMVQVVSNRTASGKTPMIAVKEPLTEVALRPQNLTGWAVRGEGRIFWERLLLTSTQCNRPQQRNSNQQDGEA
jgi:site-specific DNA recombinase